MAADRAALQRDLADAVTHLRARPEVQGRGIGAIGYCLGGRLAYVAAATAGVDAAVAYYGGGIQDMLDLAPKITCPMQFHYGELDAAIPPAAVAQVRTAMQGKPAEVFVYGQAEHGFNCWARGTYQAAAARWRTAARFEFLADRHESVLSYSSGVSRSSAITAKKPSPASTVHFSTISPRCFHTACRVPMYIAKHSSAASRRAPNTSLKITMPAPARQNALAPGQRRRR